MERLQQESSDAAGTVQKLREVNARLMKQVKLTKDSCDAANRCGSTFNRKAPFVIG